MEVGYAAAGVGHFMVDGPSLHGDTALGRPVGDTDVVAFGRDLQVSYRGSPNWLPGHAAYRDFHTYDHLTGLKTGAGDRAQRALRRQGALRAGARRAGDRHGHVADFVDVVRRRLHAESERIGRPAHVVAAFDTELFGHWWSRARAGWNGCCVPSEAGVRVAPSPMPPRPVGSSAPSVELPPSSWFGQGLAGVERYEGVRSGAQRRGRRYRAGGGGQGVGLGPGASRDFVADQILRETLTVSSDWPFMVSKDSAAEYAGLSRPSA